MSSLRILFLGDVVGAPGLRAVKRRLPGLVSRLGVDLVIANGENAAGGLGITPSQVRDLHRWGVHVVTTGNHVWAKRELRRALGDLPRLLRPANHPDGAPGKGWCRLEVGGTPVAVVNLCGRVFMNPLDCPFRTADHILAGLDPPPPVVVVDFHAEATSEKRALGWHLDGRVSAVLGTHTHVTTADAQILPGGTGYVTDVGMTGVDASVIGMPTDRALARFLTGVPSGFGVADGDARISAALVEVDRETGRCVDIRIVHDGPGRGVSPPGRVL